MDAIGGYVLTILILVAVVVATAIVVNLMLDSQDRRSRNRERLHHDPGEAAATRLLWGVPLSFWIVVAGVIVGIGGLFAMAEHTVMAREQPLPWLGMASPGGAGDVLA